LAYLVWQKKQDNWNKNKWLVNLCMQIQTASSFQYIYVSHSHFHRFPSIPGTSTHSPRSHFILLSFFYAFEYVLHFPLFNALHSLLKFFYLQNLNMIKLFSFEFDLKLRWSLSIYREPTTRNFKLLLLPYLLLFLSFHFVLFFLILTFFETSDSEWNVGFLMVSSIGCSMSEADPASRCSFLRLKSSSFVLSPGISSWSSPTSWNSRHHSRSVVLFFCSPPPPHVSISCWILFCMIVWILWSCVWQKPS